MAARLGRLILVRHGESEGNRLRRFTNSPAAPLTELGREQARAAAARIARLFRPELVIASPYARARETGEIIARELTLALLIEAGLHEQSLGALAGHPYEVVHEDPTFDPTRPWLWRPPQGESHEDVKARTAPVFDRIAALHSTREVVVVSHGGVMAAIWAHVTGSWEGAHHPPNCGIVLVEHLESRYHPPRVVGD